MTDHEDKTSGHERPYEGAPDLRSWLAAVLPEEDPADDGHMAPQTE
ncbi:hypothetical protein [Saccharopolyspora pogona]|nr:hypothetical protein [Saccharopolyspora pogona]